ncbi:hypothetical protein F5B18DRAFT_288924 [Nemania serpens]|nr:hypothetical protein F5B18DRAFT_288924 [Nemania serpens]
MSLGEYWAYYQSLLRQQQEVLESRAHVRALESGLGRFPALRKISVTAATHGRIFTPVYETPMIRAFPQGFNYAIPGWPVYLTKQPECPEWDENDKKCEGFRVMMHLLARNFDSGRVIELEVNLFGFLAGLNSRLFEEPCPTLANFEWVLGRANFESLHLDLMVDNLDYEDSVFCRGLPKRALANAAGGQGLKRLALGTNYEEHHVTWHGLLETIYDLSSLQRVEHFRHSRFPTIETDLLALLATLPLSIRTVELSFLSFFEGNHRSLLCRIRDTLGWQDRNPRPRLSLGFGEPFDRPGHATWIEQKVYAFLYEDGLNPFGEDPEGEPNTVIYNFGIVKDAIYPEYQRPNMEWRGLVKHGYL